MSRQTIALYWCTVTVISLPPQLFMYAALGDDCFQYHNLINLYTLHFYPAPC